VELSVLSDGCIVVRWQEVVKRFFYLFAKVLKEITL